MLLQYIVRKLNLCIDVIMPTYKRKAYAGNVTLSALYALFFMCLCYIWCFFFSFQMYSLCEKYQSHIASGASLSVGEKSFLLSSFRY